MSLSLVDDHRNLYDQVKHKQHLKLKINLMFEKKHFLLLEQCPKTTCHCKRQLTSAHILAMYFLKYYCVSWEHHNLLSNHRNEEDQKSFDDACSNLLQIQLLVEENCRNIREMYRQERNTFLLRLLMGFLLLAWLGTFVPGILVAYFVGRCILCCDQNLCKCVAENKDACRVFLRFDLSDR